MSFSFVFPENSEKKVRRLNGIRSEKKNPKTGRIPRSALRHGMACSIARHKTLHICPSFQKLFFVVCEGEIHSFLRFILPKKAFFVEQRREVLKVFFFMFIQ